MANLRLYPSGLTAFHASDHTRPGNSDKAEVSGWSRNSTRSLIKFLKSVNPHKFSTGSCYCFTLTLRMCPPTPQDWKRLRESFFRSLHRHEVASILWLTEWQRRGVPHLHGIVLLPCGFSSGDFVAAWIVCARKYQASAHCQHARAIYDPLGWSEYLAKHSARGVSNYQRSAASMPAGWQGKTGRMWGHRGAWPTYPPIDLQCSRAVFFRLRRLLKARALSQARSRGDPRAIRFCRTTLKCNDPILSPLRGVSHFCDQPTTLRLLDYLQTVGPIEC